MQWALLDLNRQLPIGVGTAGPQHNQTTYPQTLKTQYTTSEAQPLNHFLTQKLLPF